MRETNMKLKTIIGAILIFFIILSFGSFTYAATSGLETVVEVDKSDSDEEKMDYNIAEIQVYMEKYYKDSSVKIEESSEVIDSWMKKLEDFGVNETTVGELGEYGDIYRHLKNHEGSEGSPSDIIDDAEEKAEELQEEMRTGDSDHPIYQQPRRNTNAQNGSSASLDDMMNDADDFVNSSGGTIQYKESALQEFSNNFYNIMLSVGVAVAVIMGGILGIKYMASSVEERATTKKTLIAYAVGCVVVFGGFAIWKLVVTILQGM